MVLTMYMYYDILRDALHFCHGGKSDRGYIHCMYSLMKLILRGALHCRQRQLCSRTKFCHTLCPSHAACNWATTNVAKYTLVHIVTSDSLVSCSILQDSYLPVRTQVKQSCWLSRSPECTSCTQSWVFCRLLPLLNHLINTQILHWVSEDDSILT